MIEILSITAFLVFTWWYLDLGSDPKEVKSSDEELFNEKFLN